MSSRRLASAAPPAPPWRTALLTLAALLAGCQATPTQVVVFIDPADQGVDAAGLRVRVWDTDAQLVLDRMGPTTDVARVPLSARDDDAARRYELVAELIDADGCVTARQLARGGYEAGAQRAIRLRFDDACDGVSCSNDQTCVEGVCRAPCFGLQPLDDPARSIPFQCEPGGDAGVPDGPRIVALEAENVTSTSVEIYWELDTEATGQTEYGDSFVYGALSIFEPALLPAHRQRINGLTPGTAYHFRVHSVDGAGREVRSDERCFRTP